MNPIANQKLAHCSIARPANLVDGQWEADAGPARCETNGGFVTALALPHPLPLCAGLVWAVSNA